MRKSIGASVPSKTQKCRTKEVKEVILQFPETDWDESGRLVNIRQINTLLKKGWKAVRFRTKKIGYGIGETYHDEVYARITLERPL